MKKVWRSELSILKNNQRRASGELSRVVAANERKVAALKKQITGIHCDTARAQTAARRRVDKIARRISVLEGRLAS